MKTAFLVFAIVLNVGFAVVAFWWLARELRRAQRARGRTRP
jgi:hypothetical protein